MEATGSSSAPAFFCDDVECPRVMDEVDGDVWLVLKRGTEDVGGLFAT